MTDFSSIKLSDAVIKDVRIFPATTEVDLMDWQEHLHTLLFKNSICCSVMGAQGKTLSHGEIESNGEYLRECCEAAEEDSHEGYYVFSFVEAWHGRKILRIVAESVVKKPEGQCKILTQDSRSQEVSRSPSQVFPVTPPKGL